MSNRSAESGSEGLTGLMEIKCGVFSALTFCSSTLSFFLSFFLSFSCVSEETYSVLLRRAPRAFDQRWLRSLTQCVSQEKVTDCTKGQTWWYSFIKEREREILFVAVPVEVMRWLFLFRARNWMLKTWTMRQFFSDDFFYSPFIFMVIDISAQWPERKCWH